MSYNPSITEMIENIIVDTASRRFPKKIKIRPYLYNYLAANLQMTLSTTRMIRRKDIIVHGRVFQSRLMTPLKTDTNLCIKGELKCLNLKLT